MGTTGRSVAKTRDGWRVTLKGDFSTVPDDQPVPPWSLNGHVGSTAAPYELPPELARYRLFRVNELRNLPPKEFLGNTPVIARELVVLFGRSDSFKSFIALGWACELAAAGLHVIYGAAEGGSGITARVEAWKQHHGLSELPCLHILPGNVNLHDKGAVGDFLEAVSLYPVDGMIALVVFDTLQRNFVGGDENSARDLGNFVEGCESVRRALESAVLVIHHTKKDGEAERGIESLRNAAEAMYKTSGRRKGHLSITLQCDKLKDMPPFADIQLTFAKVKFADRIVGLDGSLALDSDLLPRPDIHALVETLLGEHGALGLNAIYGRLPKPRPRKGTLSDLLYRYVVSRRSRIVSTSEGDRQLYMLSGG